MKRLLIIGGSVVAGIIIVVFLVLYFGLNSLIKTAVESYGPRITGVPVTLEDSDVSLFSGSGSLKGFSLGNPKGFTAPKALSADDITVQVDKGSLTSDVVVIRKIHIIKPLIVYERIGKTDNVSEIEQNIKSYTGSDSSQSKDDSQTDDGSKASKKLIIEDFLIKDAVVQALLPDIQEEVLLEIPEIHLTGLGAEEGGITPKTMAARIIKALEAALQEQAFPALRKYKDDLESMMRKSMDNKNPEDSAKEMGNKLKGLFKK